MKKVFIFLFIIFTCTGCWDYKELNELGIISAMAISKNENGLFRVDMQLVNIIESGESGIVEAPISVVSGEGKTVFEAIRSMNLKVSKSFFPSNMEYLIIDKSVLHEDDLKEVMDFFARDSKLTLNFLVATSTQTKPEEILSSLSEFNINAASNLAEVIRLSEKRYGASYSLNFLDYLKTYFEPGSVSVYPNLIIKSEDDESENLDNLKETNTKSYVELYNLVAFDKNGNEINLGTDESFGYNFIKNHITNASITNACEENYFTVETLNSKFKFEEDLKNNKIKVVGDIDGEIAYYGCDSDLNKSDVLKEVTKIFEDRVKSYIESAFNLSKEYKTDFLGIGNFIYKSKPDYFDFDKGDWGEEGLSNINLDFDINANLYKQGNLKGDI